MGSTKGLKYSRTSEVPEKIALIAFINEGVMEHNFKSLINNWMGRKSLRMRASEARTKMWDWSMLSLEVALGRVFHPHAARSQAHIIVRLK